MRWHILLSICCTVTPSAAFVSPIGQVVVQSKMKQPNDSAPFAPSPSCGTKLHAARTLAVAGRIPWGNFILDYKQRMKLVSIVRMETHMFDISVVSWLCHLWK